MSRFGAWPVSASRAGTISPEFGQVEGLTRSSIPLEFGPTRPGAAAWATFHQLPRLEVSRSRQDLLMT